MTRRKNTVTRSVTLTQCRRVVHRYPAHYTLSIMCTVYSTLYTTVVHSCHLNVHNKPRTMRNMH